MKCKGGLESAEKGGWGWGAIRLAESWSLTFSVVTAPFASVSVRQRPNHQSFKSIRERLMSVYRRFLNKV